MCPGITDNTIKGQNGSILPGERNEAVRQGARPRAVMNATGRPTRCGRRCQEMIAYKMYQLPPRLPARPHHRANKHISCQPAPAQAWRGPRARQRGWEGLEKPPPRLQEARPVPVGPEQQVDSQQVWESQCLTSDTQAGRPEAAAGTLTPKNSLKSYPS